MREQIHFIGLGMSSGQGHAGPAKASQFLRAQILPQMEGGFELVDGGDIAPQTLTHPKIHSFQELGLFDWQPYEQAASKMTELLSQGQRVLNWGGDHSVGISTVGAFCGQNPEGFVLWIDAHADLNLPQHSMTGNLHGMPLSILLNLEGVADQAVPWLRGRLKPEQLIYFGLRDVDPYESQILKELKICHFTAQQIRQRGMAVVAREICEIVGSQPLHVSFDIDSVSPEYAPATGLHVPGGLTPSELMTLGSALSRRADVRSMDVVEINPDIGSSVEVDRTNELAFHFVCSVFDQVRVSQQGGFYEGVCRANQEFDAVAMEPCS
jgi:arginase